MLKEILSKISTRLFYILFAIVVSVALWMYVEITENEVQINDISNIEIVFRNEDALRDRGFLISSPALEPLTIRFEASRSDMSKLAAVGAVTAEIDLVSVASTGPAELAYTLNYPSGVNTNAVRVLSPTGRITLIIDRILERQIQVEVSYTGGTASEELIADNDALEWDPHTITVRGPETVVSKIKYIRVPIYTENLASTYTDELEFILIDDNNDVLEDSLRRLLEFSQETVRVVVPIMEMKDIALTVLLAHGDSTSEANTILSIEPKTIKVSGDPDSLREFNSLNLGTIDMMRMNLSDTEAFPIVLPNNIVNVSGETVAMVHVEVIGLEIAVISTTNLQVTNVPTGYSVDIRTQSLDVQLRGIGDDLAQVTRLNIRVVADLTGLGSGTSRVPARVFIDGIDAAIDPVGEYLLTVSIVSD